MRFSTLPLLHETLWPWDVGVRHGNVPITSRSVANREVILVVKRVLGFGVLASSYQLQTFIHCRFHAPPYTHGLK